MALAAAECSFSTAAANQYSTARAMPMPGAFVPGCFVPPPPSDTGSLHVVCARRGFLRGTTMGTLEMRDEN